MILIDYQAGGIVSKQLIKMPTGNVTLFAFDAGQALSEHTSPFDAIVTVLDGEADVTIAGETHRVGAGELIALPANVPHGVSARERFKMTLTMLRAPNVP
jgi:quercetin dioxygenase-like cupin family protein